jgi:hypothetical protein
MHSFLKPGSEGVIKPLWLRGIALVCVLMVCVMSTVQVCHVHTDPRLKQGSQRTGSGDPNSPTNPNSPTPEDHCPLCVAMHSALPVALHVAPEPIVLVQRLDSVAADVKRVFRWRFEMASRPPPADLNRA